MTPSFLRRYFASGKYLETTIHGIFHLMAVLLAFNLASIYFSKQDEQRDLRIQLAALNQLVDELSPLGKGLDLIVHMPADSCAPCFLKALQGKSPDNACQVKPLDTPVWRLVSNSEAALLIDKTVFTTMKTAYVSLLSAPREQGWPGSCRSILNDSHDNFTKAAGEVNVEIGKLDAKKQGNQGWLSPGSWYRITYAVLAVWAFWLLWPIAFTVVTWAAARRKQVPPPLVPPRPSDVSAADADSGASNVTELTVERDTSPRSGQSARRGESK